MRYFEDFQPGETATVGEYVLTADEIIAFAREWDPQARHIDPDAAARTPFGGLIASGVHLLALSVRLLVAARVEPVAVIAAVGWDEVRFLAPGRPGDTLTLHRRCLEVRPSRTKPDRGIVRNELRLVNQAGVTILSFQDSLLVHTRPADAVPSDASG